MAKTSAQRAASAQRLAFGKCMMEQAIKNRKVAKAATAKKPPPIPKPPTVMVLGIHGVTKPPEVKKVTPKPVAAKPVAPMKAKAKVPKMTSARFKCRAITKCPTC